MIQFTNTYEKLPSHFFEKVLPAPFSNPELILFNEKLANDLGIEFTGKSQKELADIFSGQNILPGSSTLAMVYAGFQFGHPVARLGDGRAILIGEVKGQDIQLKGCGRTPFSRGGDGRSALGPVLREYILSEAMNALGVPTTRALCAVKTGEQVLRQNGPEPGGIFTRVAESHLRVGTFQYFAFQNDIDSIKTLVDYTVERHYPQLKSITDYKLKSIELLKRLIEKQSDLLAKWSGYGFIHGVMNTDNFSMSGITIDYGPCAFLDEFKFEKVFSSIDKNGRYSFFNQIPIAKWNILRLAECLLPLIDNNEKTAINIIEKEILELFNQFDLKRMAQFAKKMGIENYKDSDESLVLNFLNYLEDESLDFTLAFKNLNELYLDKGEFYPKSDDLNIFLKEWRPRAKNVDQLNKINPTYIPRNHQVEKAIDDAYANNFQTFYKLIEVTSRPFKEREEYKSYSLPPKESEKIVKTFCGT